MGNCLSVRGKHHPSLLIVARKGYPGLCTFAQLSETCLPIHKSRRDACRSRSVGTQEAIRNSLANAGPLTAGEELWIRNGFAARYFRVGAGGLREGVPSKKATYSMKPPGLCRIESVVKEGILVQ